ncbi:hypothetical protein ABZP36_001315 [Zizania latifolia]
MSSGAGLGRRCAQIWRGEGKNGERKKGEKLEAPDDANIMAATCGGSVDEPDGSFHDNAQQADVLTCVSDPKSS